MPTAVRPGVAAPAEHPQTVRIAAWSLAALYALLLPLHLLLLPRPAGEVMAAVAGLSSVLLVGAAVLLRGRAQVSSAQVVAIGLAPVVNTLAHLGVTGDLSQTTLLMVTAVAFGAVLVRTSVVATLLLTLTAGWFVVIALRAVLLSTALPGLASDAIQLLVAVGAAVLLSLMRAQRERRLALSEQRFRGLFDDSPVGIGLADDQGRFVTVNEALCTLLGRPATELIGSTSAPFTHPGDLAMQARVRESIAASPQGIARMEKRYLRPDGEVRHAWLTLTRVDGPQGEAWTMAHVQDVTERFAVDQALRDSEASLAAVAAVSRRIRRGEDPRQGIVDAARELAGAMSAALVEADPDDPERLIFTHEAGTARLSGTVIPRTSTSGAAHTWRSAEPLFVADPAESPLVDPALVARSGGRSLMWQPILVHGEVAAVVALIWTERVTGMSARAARSIALFADEASVALEHDRLLRRLRDRARTDELTGLPNRRAWNHQLDRLLTRTPPGTEVTVALADLDRFKTYNDRYGHQAGDDLLRSFALRAAEVLRPTDLLARWGGEEFAVALVGENVPVRAVLDRVLRAAPAGQTLSIGSATWDGVESAEALLGRADAALYAAKAAGRARLVEAVAS